MPGVFYCGLGCLTERGVVGITRCTTAIQAIAVQRVERGAGFEAGQQVRVGDIRAAVGDQVGQAFGDRLLAAFGSLPAGENHRAPLDVAQRAQQVIETFEGAAQPVWPVDVQVGQFAAV